jgi:hypothetical protein
MKKMAHFLAGTAGNVLAQAVLCGSGSMVENDIAPTWQ